jgi:serine/threonine protein kinase
MSNGFQSMSTEIEIMKRIRHRNIVSMYELFETPKCIWMIVELTDGGDLRHLIAQKTTEYNEVVIARQMKQILSGVHYLHSLGKTYFILSSSLVSLPPSISSSL